MAKRPSYARNKPQLKRSAPSLVRAHAPTGVSDDVAPGATTEMAETPASTASVPPAAEAPVATKPAPALAKPASPAPAPVKPATPAAAPVVTPPSAKAANAQITKAQARSIARAQNVQRVRVAGLISAENYTYVRHDLMLTIGVAASMVVLMVILTFVLPNYIK